ncbi:MAG: hypothetical protein HQK55_10515, partial [Deltaproteobacteria bacterium]|nr:hypothetical protein [Deltaproteobacteria bacterium]
LDESENTAMCITPDDLAGMVAFLTGQLGDLANQHYDNPMDLRHRDALLFHDQIGKALAGAINQVKKIFHRSPASFSPDDFFLKLKGTVQHGLDDLLISALCPLNNPNNPLTEVSLKREVTLKGPGGIQRLHGNLGRRAIHPSHYGRLCQIETPESTSIGYTLHLALGARVNSETHQIETIYRDQPRGGEFWWLSPENEEGRKLAPKQAEDVDSVIQTRNHLGDLEYLPPENVDYFDAYHGQFLGLAANLIPFIQHDDNNRAMMGAKNMKQAVPLIKPERPMIRTGLEGLAARASGRALYAPWAGRVEITNGQMTLKGSVDEKDFAVDFLQGTNMKTVTFQQPAVENGQQVEAGQVLLDGSAILNGELALGTNLLAAYLPYYGYNFEDGIVISDRLVRENILTSRHMVKVTQEVYGNEDMHYQGVFNKAPDEDEEASDNPNSWVIEIEDFEKDKIPSSSTAVNPAQEPDKTKKGKKLESKKKEVTVPHSFKKNFIDGNGIFCIEGQEVVPGDLLFKKYRTDDPKHVKVVVSTVRGVINKKTRQDLHPDTRQAGVAKYSVTAHILQERPVQVGDKLMGRHGNKGVVTKIVPEHEMPCLPDGAPVDVLLNPHGVVGRMNLGQILETHWGLVLKYDPTYREKYGLIHPFKFIPEDELRQAFSKLRENELLEVDESGRVPLWMTDRKGTKFQTRAVVGCQYFMKLNHLVEDKIQARETGPYTQMTRQPTRGHKLQGGQRLGEMEVWALEAHLAQNLLKEFLTLKADDVNLRQIFDKDLTDSTLRRGLQQLPAADRHILPETLRTAVMLIRGLGMDLTFYDHKDRAIPLPCLWTPFRPDQPSEPMMAVKVGIKPADAETVKKWSHGEVKVQTRGPSNKKTGESEGTLYDPLIFQDSDYEYATRELMGHIELGCPIIHPLLLNQLLEDIRDEFKGEIKPNPLISPSQGNIRRKRRKGARILGLANISSAA